MLAASDYLAPGGAFASTHSAYENRPSQRRMAEAIAEALADGRPLLVEAGTGTGKTLAYLLPALLSGKRVIISTGTRALQEQIADKDVALLSEITGAAVRSAVLKGTTNYVCRRRLAAELVADDELVAIRRWVGRSDTGDRAELAAIPEDAAVWGRITTSADGRLGSRCPYKDECFVAEARRRAERAELVVVNHHLFFTDFALRRRGHGRVLPDYDAVIFDEAHLLEDIIATHMGPSLSSRAIALLIADLARPESGFAEARLLAGLEARARVFFDRIKARVPLAGMGRADVPLELFLEPTMRTAWLDLDTALDEVAERSEFLGASAMTPDLEATLVASSMRAQSMRDAAAEIAEPSEPPCGQWIEASGGGVRLCAAPASAGKIIAEVIAETPATIFTSATLTTERRFDFIRARLGLDVETAEALSLDSPFNYAEQALLYLPRDLPEPSEAGFGAASVARLLEVIELAGGGVFGLFTSWRALGAAEPIVRAATKRLVLVQGEAPKGALLERFRADGDAVLLATASFWEGVDVAGRALRCVVIDKLPFAVPSDPLHSARTRRIEENGGDGFGDYHLPLAALHLKQGFGRLIRSQSDRGVVCVLDRRIVSRRYGRAFLDSLPPALARTSSLEQVRRFWATEAR